METERQFLSRVLLNNAEAIEFCFCLFRSSQIIDDIHDRDEPVSRDAVRAMAWDVFVNLPSNAFYQQHMPVLQGHIRQTLLDWLDSAVLESTGDPHDQSLAFVLRESLSSLVSSCAYLIGGYAHMVRVSPEVRRYFHDGTFAEYVRDLEDNGMIDHQNDNGGQS